MKSQLQISKDALQTSKNVGEMINIPRVNVLKLQGFVTQRTKQSMWVIEKVPGVNINQDCLESCHPLASEIKEHDYS